MTSDEYKTADITVWSYILIANSLAAILCKKNTFLKWNVKFHKKVKLWLRLICSKRQILTSGDLTLESVYFFLNYDWKICSLKQFVIFPKSRRLREWITLEPGRSESSDAPSRGSPTLLNQSWYRDKEMGHLIGNAAMTLFVAPSSG